MDQGKSKFKEIVCDLCKQKSLIPIGAIGPEQLCFACFNEKRKKVSKWYGWCSRCNIQVFLDWVPRENRPVYCRRCLVHLRHNPEPVWTGECDECGEYVELNFNPDKGRTVLCRKCLKKARNL